ncbi:hypothetical protein AcW1_009383 [Taiwanofungus camphoratus]|nr:hypothetical protein AcW1_009383 [Antrodia cinnamomea]
MFSAAIQPGIVSLFSSTGSDPLRLFSSSKDVSLPADSFVCLLKDSTSLPAPPRPATLMQKPPSSDQAADGEGHAPDHAIEQTVLHIQSPTLRTTFIRCPPTTWTDTSRGSGRARSGDLGMKHPWIHFQVRNMGREWSFEIGVVDQSGREGIVRCSTFQVLSHYSLTLIVDLLVIAFDTDLCARQHTKLRCYFLSRPLSPSAHLNVSDRKNLA